MQFLSETLDEVQDCGDQLLLLAHGPEVLKWGQVEEYLLSGPEAFFEQFDVVSSILFSTKEAKGENSEDEICLTYVAHTYPVYLNCSGATHFLLSLAHGCEISLRETVCWVRGVGLFVKADENGFLN